MRQCSAMFWKNTIIFLIKGISTFNPLSTKLQENKLGMNIYYKYIKKLVMYIDWCNTTKICFITHDCVRIVTIRRYKLELTLLDQKKSW